MSKVKVVCPHCLSINTIPKKDSYAKANCGKCKKSLLDTTPKDLDASAFDTLLANSEIPVVIDFWAPWCGPCKMMGPAFSEASQSFALQVHFAKLNTETQQHVASRFNIRSIPTTILFKNNHEVDRISGALSSEDIKNWIKQKT